MADLPSRRRSRKKPKTRLQINWGLWGMIAFWAILAVSVYIGVEYWFGSDENADPPKGEDVAKTPPSLIEADSKPAVSEPGPATNDNKTQSPNPIPEPVPSVANNSSPPAPVVNRKPLPPGMKGERGLSGDDARKLSDEFFDQGIIPELRIVVDEQGMQNLKQGATSFVIGEQRPYVSATITENGVNLYENVALKLKGSAGSYRHVDDRPAFTINVDKFEKDQSFHGLGKFHLNNSVQDPSYMHEWLAADVFKQAGVPSVRVSHARVWLNNRDLGLYVLKASFDKAFLKRHFGHSKGNLYEGGFVQDIDIDLEKDVGTDPNDRTDLKALLAACREADGSIRAQRLEQLLDVESFISFMAAEMMVCHWDGYTLNHNNYRLFFNEKTGKASFIAHGMDQLFGDPNATVINFPSSIVGGSVMNVREWRARYRDRLKELLTLFSPANGLHEKVDSLHGRLRPILQRMSAQTATDHDNRVKDLKARLTARAEGLERQKSLPDPTPPEFDESGRLALTGWIPVTETPDAKLEMVPLKPADNTYTIKYAGKTRCNASWRCKVPLRKGTYTLHGKMRTRDVTTANEKDQAVGAVVLVAGAPKPVARKGTLNWVPVKLNFEVVEEMRTVEIILELKAKKGQVWFDADSLHLTKADEK